MNDISYVLKINELNYLLKISGLELFSKRASVGKIGSAEKTLKKCGLISVVNGKTVMCDPLAKMLGKLSIKTIKVDLFEPSIAKDMTSVATILYCEDGVVSILYGNGKNNKCVLDFHSLGEQERTEDLMRRLFDSRGVQREFPVRSFCDNMSPDEYYGFLDCKSESELRGWMLHCNLTQDDLQNYLFGIRSASLEKMHAVRLFNPTRKKYTLFRMANYQDGVLYVKNDRDMLFEAGTVEFGFCSTHELADKIYGAITL